MKTDHTPEPWRIGTPPPNGEQTIGNEKGLMVAVATTGHGVSAEANARRIVACVNACEDILDYELSLGCVARLSEQLRTITKQRDELLAALDTFISEHEECEDADGWMAFMCSTEAFHVADEAADSVKAATCGEPGKLTKTECSEGSSA